MPIHTYTPHKSHKHWKIWVYDVTVSNFGYVLFMCMDVGTSLCMPWLPYQHGYWFLQHKYTAVWMCGLWLPISYSFPLVESLGVHYPTPRTPVAGSQTGSCEGRLWAPFTPPISFFPFSLCHPTLWYPPFNFVCLSHPLPCTPSPLVPYSSQPSLPHSFALFICLLMCWENKGTCMCVTEGITYDHTGTEPARSHRLPAHKSAFTLH